MSRFDDLWQGSSNQSSIKTNSHVDQGLRTYMIGVFGYMGLGLFLTALVAFFSSQSMPLMQLIFATPLRWLIAFAPLGVVIYFGAKFHKLSYNTARLCFMVYAGLIGLSLSSIFLMYQGASIARIFLVSSCAFGSMSIYGYTTQKDLTTLGSFLMMGVMGVLIAAILNMFFQSSMTATIISILCVLIFTGLTAYNTQQIKELYYQGDVSSNGQGKKAIYGALQLYINFINIFVSLLHLFGDRRD